MNVAKATKTKLTLTEEDILASLDSAISSYNTKDLSEVAVVKPIKRKATKSKKITVSREAEPEEVLEVVKVKKTSKRKRSTVKAKKKAKKLLKSVYPRKMFSGFKSFKMKYKNHLTNSALAFVMLAFVSLSSYVAYAYVISGNSDLVSKVSEHVILPVGESPKVYIIQSEKSEIFQNPLFNGIQVGDNVLSFINAGKVYIYRSSADKIVNIVNTAQ